MITERQIKICESLQWRIFVTLLHSVGSITPPVNQLPYQLHTVVLLCDSRTRTVVSQLQRCVALIFSVWRPKSSSEHDKVQHKAHTIDSFAPSANFY